jgi:hypothetical protein
MKNLILLVIVILLPISYLYAGDNTKGDESTLPVIAGGQDNGNLILGGGPDSFGYRWKDSNDPGGPVFNWVNISVIGTEITPWPHGTVDDGYTDPISLGMTFTYYGIDYTSVVVSTNGWASFLTQTNSYLSNVAIPTAAAPNALLAVDWDDLDGGTVGHCYYYSDVAQNRFIVSWVNWPYYPDPAGPHDFQIIINSSDSSVVYQYGSGDYTHTSMTVGIENETGTIGLQLAYNTAYPTNNLATRFYRPPTLAHDVGVDAILSPGSFTYKDTTYTVSSKVKNFGSNTETNVDVGFIIKDTTGTTVYNHTYIVPTLPPDAESTITFEAAWVPGEGKTHTMKSFTSLGSDLDRTNDTTRATTYTFAYHGTGGPVGYWSYADNNSGGPAFNWIELAGLGDTIHFASRDDNNAGFQNMGLNFQFFGGLYSRISVCTNGWMSFTDSTSTALGNLAMPDPTLPNALVALLWDDLYIPTTGKVIKHYDAVNNQFIVEYDSVEFYPSGGPDCIKMEAIFNGNNNTIKMQYDYFCDSSQSDITIGIENETGTVGLAYDNNGEILQRPSAGLAVTWTFTPPAHDIRPEVFLSPGPSGFTGHPITPQVTFRNIGASDESNVPVRLLISPGAYNNLQTIPSIDSGSTANATFVSFTPPTGGIYTLTAIAQLPSDIDHSNDTLRTSFIAYDTILDFEANNGGLLPSNDWQWGAPTSGPNGAYSGQNCWATILDGNYNAGLSTLLFDLNVGTTNPSISFVQWYETESGYDGGNFSISTDGVNWTVISPTRGYDAASNSTCPLYPDSIFCGLAHEFWQNVTFPLNAFAGQSVLARLAFGANSTTFYPGWYVDDLGLSDCRITFPNFGYNPNSIVGSAPPGNSTSAPLTLSNSGSGPLFFTARAVQDIIPPPITANVKASPLGYRTVSDKNATGSYSEPYYPPVIQNQGGPDEFGNYWIDSDEPNGPVYDWVDITSIGTAITGLSDDSNVGPFSFGFDFYFYGNAYNSFRFCTNGFLSFTSTATQYNNAAIPSGAEPFNLMAPFWDDQNFTNSGAAYYYANSESLVVSWINVPHFSSGGPYTYQVILLANGKMLFQYQTMNTPLDGSTIGIQNTDGTDGLQVAYNQAYVHDSLAILFVAPTRWLSIDANSGSIPPGGNPVVLNVGMDATDLLAGTYTGNIYLNSNDPNQAQVTIPVTFTVTGGGGCLYIPGDINNNHSVNGVDIVYAVNYFKGVGNPPPIDCFPNCPLTPNPFFAAGDVNGNCAFNGIDITYFVRYLKGQVPSLLTCPNCPPGGLEVPAVMPILNPKINIQKHSTGK